MGTNNRKSAGNGTQRVAGHPALSPRTTLVRH